MEDCAKLDAGMQALWHLGIVAVHDVGSGRGEGLRECRRLYDAAGGPDSGHLGFCYYRRPDAEAAGPAPDLELVCGDFLDKNLLTREVRDVVRDALRQAGLDAVANRKSTNRVTLRSFALKRAGPPPPPPLDATPRPPERLVAASTAVPAASAPPPPRSYSSSGALGKSPLQAVKDLALGVAAPMRVPDVPGVQAPQAGDAAGQAPRRGRRPKPFGAFAVGVSCLVVGSALLVAYWAEDSPWRVNGTVLAALGLVLVLSGRGRRRKPLDETRGGGSTKRIG